jgi:hypothetical protein
MAVAATSTNSQSGSLNPRGDVSSLQTKVCRCLMLLWICQYSSFLYIYLPRLLAPSTRANVWILIITPVACGLVDKIIIYSLGPPAI